MDNGLSNIQYSLAGLERQMESLQRRNSALEEQLGQLQIEENIVEDWLQVPFRIVSLGIGATSIIQSRVGGDGPFDLVEITHTAVDSAGAANSDFRVLIREGEAVGRSLTQDQEQIDADNTSGTAQRPYIIKGRRRFRGNITITVEITNTSVNTNTIELVLHGIKVFTR